MFTRKRKNYQTFLYAAVVATLCFLILALLWPQEETDETDPKTVSLHSAVRQSDEADRTDEDESGIDAPGEDETAGGLQREDGSAAGNDPGDDNKEDTQKDNMTDNPGSYYLVKRADGLIKVFFVDGLGEMIELEDTRIVYEVLGPEDQKLFDEGCRVETQEALAVLLQDFES